MRNRSGKGGWENQVEDGLLLIPICHNPSWIGQTEENTQNNRRTEEKLPPNEMIILTGNSGNYNKNGNKVLGVIFLSSLVAAHNGLHSNSSKQKGSHSMK
jgi:hypothetical protein